MNPYWYKLIKLFKAEKIITTGITIPYLFGAYKILGTPFDNIEHLISVVLNSSIDKYPVIQKCHVIQQHVLMIEEKEVCNKYYKKDVRIDSSSSSLFISTNTDLGKTFDRICLNLAAYYSNPIDRNRFSWDNKQKAWMEFDKLDKDLIRSIK